MAVSVQSHQLGASGVGAPRDNIEAEGFLGSSLGHPNLSPWRIPLANQVPRAGLDSGGGELDGLIVVGGAKPVHLQSATALFFRISSLACGWRFSVWPFRVWVTTDERDWLVLYIRVESHPHAYFPNTALLPAFMLLCWSLVALAFVPQAHWVWYPMKANLVAEWQLHGGPSQVEIEWVPSSHHSAETCHTLGHLLGIRCVWGRVTATQALEQGRLWQGLEMCGVQ